MLLSLVQAGVKRQHPRGSTHAAARTATECGDRCGACRGRVAEQAGQGGWARRAGQTACAGGLRCHAPCFATWLCVLAVSGPQITRKRDCLPCARTSGARAVHTVIVSGAGAGGPRACVLSSC